MKVLVIGNGGREHALAWKLKESPRVEQLFIAPGNPGMANLGTLVPIKPTDIDQLVDFAVQNAIDLTVVGPESPLCWGLSDALKAKGLKVFGPSKAAAKLEGSKVEMKEFLRRHNIPTAQFKVFSKSVDALAYLDEVGAPIVVKADGLAAGKGVTVAKTVEEAKDAVVRIMDKHEFVFIARLHQPGDRRKRAHAARHRTFIAIADLLVVLNVIEQHGVVPIAQGEHRDFFAAQDFFDDDLTPGLFAEFVLVHDPDHGVFGLFNRLGNRHALACG